MIFFAVPGRFTSQAQTELSSPPDLSAYPWMQAERNIIQFFDPQALRHFYQTWALAPYKKFSVVHVGDSHLQPDIFPGRLREHLHRSLGDGGRGLMFAYSTLNTYSSIYYKSSHTGSWTAARSITIVPKLPLGVVGMACKTLYAGSSLTFSFYKEVPAHYTQLKIFCKKVATSYDLLIEAGDAQIPVVIDSSQADLPYVLLTLPSGAAKTITLKTVKSQASETDFEFYGMSLESPQDQGAILHNGGVGGARYQSVLYEKLFKAQLPSLLPDLVIVDFGTNDYLYDDKIKPELESEIRKVVQTIREVAPEASILLTTAQDLYFKGQHVKSGPAFAALIFKVAEEMQCGVYDWFWISGGPQTMLKWVESKLAQTDKIHLTMSGYRLKGDLLFAALEEAIDWKAQNPEANRRVLPKPQNVYPVAVSKPVNPAPVSSPSRTAPALAAQHTVKAGETLYVIARQYGLSVEQLVKWNQIPNANRIQAGQVLRLRE
ncbi:MAG: LysM peptidoglycan-binding domain-containing protein [Microscillaceae bacterium]|nr:LysM peptidoglycan-binding domain-containing protein [Microscillaceae bacterium]